MCFRCDQPMKAKHILVDCVDFAETRRSNFHIRDLKHLFSDIPVDDILSFFKEINLVTKM